MQFLKWRGHPIAIISYLALLTKLCVYGMQTRGLEFESLVTTPALSTGKKYCITNTGLTRKET